jgi:hypothetical protein
MPETMKGIQKKHDKAMAALAEMAEEFELQGTDGEYILRPVRAAREAFAAAVQHHTNYVTKLKGATKVAREIEDARKKGE